MAEPSWMRLIVRAPLVCHSNRSHNSVFSDPENRSTTEPGARQTCPHPDTEATWAGRSQCPGGGLGCGVVPCHSQLMPTAPWLDARPRLRGDQRRPSIFGVRHPDCGIVSISSDRISSDRDEAWAAGDDAGDFVVGVAELVPCLRYSAEDGFVVKSSGGKPRSSNGGRLDQVVPSMDVHMAPSAAATRMESPAATLRRVSPTSGRPLCSG